MAVERDPGWHDGGAGGTRVAPVAAPGRVAPGGAVSSSRGSLLPCCHAGMLHAVMLHAVMLQRTGSGTFKHRAVIAR